MTGVAAKPGWGQPELVRVARAAPIWRKSRRYVALASAVLLAACESIVPRAAEPPPAATVPAPAPPPVASTLPTDQTHHRIALLVPLSGRNAGIGQSLQNATTMALLDTRAENIRMTAYDTAQGAGQAARQAISDGNKLIIGPLLSDNVVAAADIARPANVPILSFSNDVGVAGDNVFMLGHVPSQSIGRVVAYAKSRGLNRFAGIVSDDVYGQRASSALYEAARDVGATVTAVQSASRDSDAIERATRRVAEAGPADAVLLAYNGDVAVKIGPYVRNNIGSDVTMLGTDLWNTSSALAGAPAMRGAWFASVSDALYKQYADKYRERHGEAPFRLSSLGYDAVLLTAKVAQDWPIGTPFPLAQLTDPGGFIGLDGVFRFMPGGKSQRALEIQEIRRGSFAVIDPAPSGF